VLGEDPDAAVKDAGPVARPPPKGVAPNAGALLNPPPAPRLQDPKPPPVLAPKPPVLDPKPPVLALKPPVLPPNKGAAPDAGAPKPPALAPRPPVLAPKPPVRAPKPPVLAPKPPVPPNARAAPVPVAPKPPALAPKAGPEKPGAELPAVAAGVPKNSETGVAGCAGVAGCEAVPPPRMDPEGVDTAVLCAESGNFSMDEDPKPSIKSSSSSITSWSSSDAGRLAEAASEVLPAGAGLATDFVDAPPRLNPPPLPPNAGTGTALAPKPPVPPNAGAALAVLQLGATLAPKPPVPRVAIPNPPELAPNAPAPPPKPPPVDAPPVAGAKLKEAAAAAPVDVAAPPKLPKEGAGEAAEVEEAAVVADVAAPDPPVAGAKLKEAAAAAPVDVAAPPKLPKEGAGEAAEVEEAAVVAPKGAGAKPKAPLPNVAGAVPAAKPPPLLAPKGAGANPAHGKYVTPLVPPAPNVAPRAYAKSRFSALVAASARRDRLQVSRPLYHFLYH
jgi:WAS/WASL-interacting protein